MLAEDSRQNTTLERAKGEASRRGINEVGISSDPRIDVLTQKLDQLITLQLSQQSRSSPGGSTPVHPSVVEVCAVCLDSSHETTACRTHMSTLSICRKMCALRRGTRGSIIFIRILIIQGGGIILDSLGVRASPIPSHPSNSSSRDLVLLIPQDSIMLTRQGCQVFFSVRLCLHLPLHLFHLFSLLMMIS